MPSSAHSWRDLLWSLITKWKMLQFVSAALLSLVHLFGIYFEPSLTVFHLSAVLTIFQLTGASTDPMMRTVGFVSFVCAFVGFLCASLYIVLSPPLCESENENANRSGGDIEGGTDTSTSRQWGEVGIIESFTHGGEANESLCSRSC